MQEQKSENSGENIFKNIRKNLGWIVLIGIAICTAISFYGDIRKVKQAIYAFQWIYLIPVLILILGKYLGCFIRWDFYLKTSGIKVPLKENLIIFISGLGMTVTPGKLGELLKAFLLKKYNGTEISKTISVVLVERISDVLGLLVLITISFQFAPIGNKIMVIVPAILVILLITIILWKDLCYYIIRICKRLPVLNRFTDNLKTSYATAYNLFKLKSLVLSLIISVLSWGCECIATYLILQGFGIHSTWLFSVFLYSFSILIGAISMIPGGLLVSEGSLAGLLILSGTSNALAVSATLMIRLCTLWFATIIGLSIIFINRNKYRGKIILPEK
jgi:glycosyltransferase 2 family protein